MDLWPASWTDTDNPSGTDAFDDQVGLESNPDTAAAKRSIAFEPCDLKDWASAGHMAGAIGPVGVFQGVLDGIHHCGNVLLEVGVEG
ncbi:MAG: hypothetical protein O3B25_09875, partial [Verrucomicrobia bacterium]|nr:hypothetical protein [Verrucomicrobiota bacterium]